MPMKTKEEKRNRRGPRGRAAQMPWPFEKENYRLFGISLLVILIGYIFLVQGPWDSFYSRTLGPIILVIGYCILIPYAILYRKKEKGNVRTGVAGNSKSQSA